jgi:exodeoxyribonuclease III
MKVITYNLNGVRAAIQKGLIDWLKATDADVVCFQETKAQKIQIPISLFEDLGYHTHWHSAEKKGYSGTAILSKMPPKSVNYGYESRFGLDDSEGRVLRADFDDLSVISVYIPSGSSGEERQDFKMRWLDLFYDYIAELKKERPNLLICGDYNICHQAIDIHNPQANAKTSGFLPEERAWLTKFFELGFIDTFRTYNAEPHHYTWWSQRSNARAKNLGWRIDYQSISHHLKDRIRRAVILNEAHHSDHCPVLVELD